ncbi:hypothetical protein MHM84_21315 [Halomonas sp. McH1-25]|uniref:hypothetical protein n=1 Tax=unclassified Halomonas TaxID=2609666 RepID=UPI001EF4F867|nr:MULTISPECIES: hypothetical protein [unclassified Halomonas]MCG7602277.1 hypothetical protein [Halomonas sp. McH1-25]MCP1344698.1 hypothetical protein [Halomonas sp. FL8]MCP1363290.1 hypothetical protein [Halomonas sp. BBD45]MCP1364020.1 hypothetical protein [Halomonas sp. BBD48]
MKNTDAMQTYIELSAHTLEKGATGSGKLSKAQYHALKNALGGMFGAQDPDLREAALKVWQMLDDARKPL